MVSHHKYYSMLVTDRLPPAFQPGVVWRSGMQADITLILLCHIHSLCSTTNLQSVNNTYK